MFNSKLLMLFSTLVLVIQMSNLLHSIALALDIQNMSYRLSNNDWLMDIGNDWNDEIPIYLPHPNSQVNYPLITKNHIKKSNDGNRERRIGCQYRKRPLRDQCSILNKTYDYRVEIYPTFMHIFPLDKLYMVFDIDTSILLNTLCPHPNPHKNNANRDFTTAS